MSFDFSLAPRVEEWRDRITRFVDDVVIPREQQAFADGVDDALRVELQREARAAGLWAPQAPAEAGGGGFAFDEAAVLLEEAGRSLLGPLALNCSSPDEGNIHLLHMTGSAAQREKYLLPLVAGEVRSCFAMTEPPPGAGSDPGALRTSAAKVAGGWVISGDKHLITGAQGAAFAIAMAANADGSGATMFLVDADNPGFLIRGHARTIDSTAVGGHCQVRFEDAFVPDDAVLGEPGKGFRYAQVRLAPARLTHCMRWLGAARRAHDIASGYAQTREVFGQKLGQHEGVGFMLADNEVDIRLSRLSIWHTAWVLDQGQRGGTESSMSKLFCSEAIYRVADRCVQVLGGQGVTGETLVERIFREVRGFRIYDGPSEVHRWSIAQKIMRQGANW